jgi:hypothetical protein
MTLAAPFFAWAAGAVALATAALHLLAWRRPPESPLPTARFAPERPIRMVSRAVRPADLALMALRMSMVLLVGFALAGPSFASRREGAARVIVLDRSRSVGDGVEAARSARDVFRAGDALVVFDSSVREVASPTADSVAASRPSNTPGSLSAALIVAGRVARRLANDHDSVAIIIVSPVTADELDAATPPIRRTWSGPIRVLRVGGIPVDTAPPGRPEVRAPSGDPVAAALALAVPLAGGRSARVVRGTLTTADSAWARAGNVLVAWPLEPPVHWERRARADTAYAVSASSRGAGPATVVAPFVRAVAPPAGRVIARWSDGEPAVTEAAFGAGCVRSASVPVPAAGDLPLTPQFRRFAERMAAPCGTGPSLALASDSVVSAVFPAEPPAATTSEVGQTALTRDSHRTLVAWMLGLALAAALGEMFLRRGDAHAAA